MPIGKDTDELYDWVFSLFSAVIGAIVSAATSGRSHGSGGGGGGGGWSSGGSYAGGHATYATPTRTKTIILKKGRPSIHFQPVLFDSNP